MVTRKRIENFKFTLFTIFTILVLGGAGYWAFTTIESGSSHVDSEKQKRIEKENKVLAEENHQLKRQLSLLTEEKEQSRSQEETAQKAEVEKPIEIPKKEEVKPTTPATTTQTINSKHQTLINELQKMVNNNTNLKLKSQGPSVGSVQKFLNIYNNTSTKVDNDYGEATVSAVKNFQKAQGLTADGQAGPGTFKKMITWLKSQ